MRVLVINPNSTAAMTAHVAEHLGLYLPSATDIVQRTATSGASVIATQQSFDAAAQTACEMLRQSVDEGWVFDRVLLACFGDPGLEALQLLTNTPVTGLAQASMQVAERLKQPYAIVTAGKPWKTILAQRLRQWGASPLFRGVQVIDGTGLDVFNDPSAALPSVQRAIATARADGTENIILGGAVFAGYRAMMQKSGLNTQGLLDCVESSANSIRQIDH